jgi:hypothetical protein
VAGLRGHFLVPRIDQGRRNTKIRVRDQGGPLMSGRPGGGSQHA